MRPDWEIKTIGEVCEIYNGGTPSTSIPEYWDGGIQWITPKDMGKTKEMYVSRCERTISQEGVEHSSTRVLPERSVIVSSRAPIGYVAINDVPMATNQGCKGFVLGKELYPEFLYYFLLASTELLNKLGTGATFKEVSGKKLAGIEVPVPSIQEQLRFVDILDQEFAKIDALKTNAEKSLQAAKDLFQATLKKELEPKEGWTYLRLNDIYNFIDYRGSTPTKLTEGIPLITAKNIKMGYLDYSIKDFISPEEYEHRQSRGISHRGDILFTTEAPLGNIAIADKDVFSAGQRVITFQQYPNSTKQLNNRFYLYYFLSPSFQETLKEQATGATAQGIKASRLKEIRVPLVDSCIQNSITERLDDLNDKCQSLQDNYQKTLSLCDDLKQALLRKAFNGEL